MSLTLESSIQYVPRVGPSMAGKVHHLGIHTVSDLLYYAPFRYNDYSLVSPIGQTQPGEVVTVRGTVLSIKTFITKTGKRIQQAKLQDDSGTLTLIWFNQVYLLKIIAEGSIIAASGKVDWFGKTIAMVSPDYEILSDATSQSLHTGRLVPVYSETAGVSSKWLRGRIAYLFEQNLHNLEDYIPEIIRTQENLFTLAEAIQAIHYPKTLEEAYQGRRRLAFDELFLIQLHALEQKRIRQQTFKSHALTVVDRDVESFLKSLPFSLTNDQQRSITEITDDVKQSFPMNRLLEGDVGSGKTVVATVAMYLMYQNNLQSILMAPTQILAEQHYHTIAKLVGHLSLPVQLVTGGKKILDGPLLSQPSIIVGTHALLSQNITFENVGLVIIDEQQRFGVDQRKLLKQKAEGNKLPHLLSMTATPIPRTIALTLYGNLDLSVIGQMPKGRKEIKTWVVPNEKRDKAYDWIKKEITTNNSQVFIVCPRIEADESTDSVKSAKAEYDRLAKTVFPHHNLLLLHGKMKPKEKTEALALFSQNRAHILVTTPVVEVGIDIPNATIMLIEGSERFGLAQLHQLRGRVGRGEKASYCLLFADTDEEHAIERLKALETTHSGPELAEIDLAMRGPGDLFGTRQHGLPNLRFGSYTDMSLLQQTKKAAMTILAMSPQLVAFPLLRQKLEHSTIGTHISED